MWYFVFYVIECWVVDIFFIDIIYIYVGCGGFYISEIVGID